MSGWQDVEAGAQGDVELGADQRECAVRVDGVSWSGPVWRMFANEPVDRVEDGGQASLLGGRSGAPSLVTSRASVPLLNAETAFSAATEVPQTVTNLSM